MRFEEKFKRQCRTDRLALTTERSYWAVTKKFILWTGAKSEEELRQDATENFREFIGDEANRDVSASTQNQAFHTLPAIGPGGCAQKFAHADLNCNQP
jgi:hypothetical protein